MRTEDFWTTYTTTTHATAISELEPQLSYVKYTPLRHSGLERFHRPQHIQPLAQEVYNNTTLCWQFVSEICTPATCPNMSAGSTYTYLWKDKGKYPKPTNLPAAEVRSSFFIFFIAYLYMTLELVRFLRLFFEELLLFFQWLTNSGL